MSDESCIHDLAPGTCSICKEPSVVTASQATLDFSAIEKAVNELGSSGDFRTTDVAQHSVVRKAHDEMLDDPQFNQHIGMYLSGALGRLSIEQISPKGVSNTRWRRRV